MARPTTRSMRLALLRGEDHLERRSGLLMVILACALVGAALLQISWTDSAGQPDWQDLRRGWSMAEGDDLSRSLEGYDHSDWDKVDFPISWSGPRATADWWWFRRVVEVPSDWLQQPLALEIGNFHSAYEVFANGERIGGAGLLRPTAADFDRDSRFVVSCACPDGRLVLAIRVWRDARISSVMGGLTAGHLRLAPAADLLAGIEPLGGVDLLYLSLATLFAGLGILYLELYRRRPRQPGHLWIGLLAFGYGLYLILSSQLRYRLGLSPGILKEAEHAVVMVLPAIYVELQRTLLEADSGAIGRWMRNLWLGIAAIAVLPGLSANYWLLPLWQYSVVGGLCWCAWQLLVAVRSGSRRARTVFAAILAGGVFIAHDILAEALLLPGPSLAWLGLVLVVGACAVALADHLQELYERLDLWSQDLDRMVATKTLRLSQVSEAKSRFLATVSHEIRTPLAAVLGYNSLLLETPLDATQRDYVLAASRSGDAVLALLEGVLDLAQIEAGRVTLKPGELLLSDVCAEAMEIVAGEAQSKGLDLAYDVQPDVDSLIGDSAKLRQIILNLLSNAVKFTPAGSVWLEARRDHQALLPRVCISVADTGIGIDPRKAAELLEPFVQDPDATAGRPRGTGLGLAISKGLAEAMGGTLSLARGCPSGTVATVSLPLTPGSSQPANAVSIEGRVLLVGLGDATARALQRWLERWGAQPITPESDPGLLPVVAVVHSAEAKHEAALALDTLPAAPAVVKRICVGLPDPTTAADAGTRYIRWPIRQSDVSAALAGSPAEISIFRRTDRAAEEAEVFPGLRVLAVDDDDSNRMVVEAMLATRGVVVDTAADGPGALALLAHDRYDLVLLDLRLPGASGYEVAAAVRASATSSNHTTLLVALTADTLTDERERCLAAGFDDHIAKPIHPAQLAALLRRARERARS